MLFQAMNELEAAQEAVEEWEQMRSDPGRTKTFQEFLDSLDSTAVRKAKVKFGKEWGESK